MKRISRKLSVILMTVMLAVMMILSTAAETQAATTTLQKRVVTLYSSKSKNDNSFFGKYVSANMYNIAAGPKSFKFQSLKSADTKKATLTLKNGTGFSAGAQAVVATFKKTGNVTLSYKKEGTVNKQTFVVKKYTNPLKSFKIDGKNIASKFKKDNVYVLPYAKYAGKKIKISYSGASNFEIDADYLLQPGNMKSDMVKNNGTVTIQKKNSALLINAYNTKTQQNETCMVIFQ